MKRTLAWLYEHCKFSVPLLILLTILGAATSVVTVSFALVIKNFTDSATGQTGGGVIQNGAMIVGMILLSLILQVATSRLNARALFRLDMKIKQSVFRSLLEKDYTEVSAYHSGELINRLTSDVSVVSSGVVSIIPDFTATVVRIVISFIYLFMLDPVLSVALVSVGPFVLIFGRFYGGKVKKLHKAVQKSDGVTRSFMQEMLQNIVVVKSFVNENRVSDKAADYQEISYKFKIRRNTLGIIANVGLFIIFTGGFFAALALGVYKLSHGLITVGALLAIMQLVSQLQTPFMSLSGTMTQAFSTIASAERLIEVENIKREDTKFSENNYGDAVRLVIKDVSFAYESAEILKDVNIKIEKGEFVALTGQSGVGKSTVLRLLLSLITPDSGEIYIERENGSKTAVSADTRDYFSYVPQGNMIVAGSIAENIKFFNTDISDETARECAEIAQVNDFASELPDGLDTVLKEGGEGLSEGQIQRIAIARALAYDRPALLLDEATSALDERTEIKVLQGIRKLNKSCIIVSHRQAAAAVCDREWKLGMRSEE